MNLLKVKVIESEKELNLLMMKSDILKREEVIKLSFGNFLSTTISEKNHKSSCYLQKYYIYVFLYQKEVAYTILLSLCFQEHSKYLRKNFSMITGDCMFLTVILSFSFSISFLKISLVELLILNYNFSQALRMTQLLPGASKYCYLKIHYLIFCFQSVL